MASVYGWLLPLVLSCLGILTGVYGQNTTECLNLAANLVCTNEHPSPPNCSQDLNQSPLVHCAANKDDLSRRICPNLVKLVEAALKSTFETLKETCSDHELSNGFMTFPKCWQTAAKCSIMLNAVPEGQVIENCGRFDNYLAACQKEATGNCSSLQTQLFKKALHNNPCFKEPAFGPASSAHFPAVPVSLSLSALLILRLLI